MNRLPAEKWEVIDGVAVSPRGIKIDHSDLIEYVGPIHIVLDPYPCIIRKGKKSRLHRIIAGAEKGQIVDHINRDRRDIRRCNLRIVSAFVNTVNRSFVVPTTSRFRGVSRRLIKTTVLGKTYQYQYWQASLGFQGKNRLSRVFKTEEEAALAYNETARRYFGEHAQLNVVT